MGTGGRFYLQKADGDLQRLSRRLAEDLRSGDAALPAFASTKQRIIVLVLEFVGRAPRRLLDVQGQVWTFDADGKTAASMWREHCARIELLPGALDELPHGVLDARQQIAARKLQAETRWDVPDDLLHRIAADLRARS